MTTAPCELEANYAFWAACLMGSKEGPRDPFLEYAGSLVLQTAFKKYKVQSPQDMEKVYAFIKNASCEDYRDFLAGTKAEPYITSHFIGEAIRFVISGTLGAFFQSPHSSSSIGKKLFPTNTNLKQRDKKDDPKTNN